MTETKHIIAGFVEDLALIRANFTSTSPNLKLEDFFVYWKNAHLNCLFANRLDPRELLESIAEMNKRLIAVVTDEIATDESRVVALYMLFCLAVKQPQRLRRKMRLTCRDAILVHHFCDKISQAKGHSGAKFCWQFLRTDDCIDFVEERLIYGPSMLSKRSLKNQTDAEEIKIADPTTEAKLETRDFIYSKLEPSLRQLEGLCTQYKQMRDQLQLDEVSDATVEMSSQGTLNDYLEQANSLLVDFKTSEHL